MAEQKISDDHILSTKYLIHAIIEGKKYGERFCFIFGAGASVSSGIPTGAELEYRWMEDMEKSPGLEEVQMAAKALKEKGKLDYEFKEIEKVWRDAKAQKQTSLPSEYYFDIYTVRFHPNYSNGYHYLENLMEHAKPSFGYHPLSLLLADGGGSNLVITTNFDNLVEDSLFLYTDKKPLVINHELLAEFAGDLNIRRPVIAKIHRGIFFNPLNRAEETKKLHGKWKEVLKKVFQNYTPIVIGYGGGDSSLMGVLEEESVTMKNGIYWCYVEKYGLPSDKIQTIIENKNGYLVHTAGFDAVMAAIGNALFSDRIKPQRTEEYLTDKINMQIVNYGKEYNRFTAEENGGKLRTEEQSNESERELKKDIEELKAGVNWLDGEREKLKQMTVGDYSRQGDRYYNAGEYEKSIEYYDKVIELRPTAMAYYDRGCAYAGLEEWEKAIEDYTKAIELNPNYEAAYNNRGYAYDSLGELEKAIADYTKAIELDPNDEVAYNNRGCAYDSLGELEKAIADYTKAIELNSNYEAAYNNRGYAYDSLGELEKAIADYTKAIELNPDYANPHKHLGVIWKKQGNLRKAEKHLTKSIELNPKYKEAYQERAKVYHSLGEEAKAAADEEAASKL